MEFHEKLVTLRRGRGLSQEALAEQLGVTRQAVSRWEQGDTTPELATLVKICRIFEVSADELILDAPPKVPAAPTAPAKTRDPWRLAAVLLFYGLRYCAAISVSGVPYEWMAAVSLIGSGAPLVLAFLNLVWYLTGETGRREKRQPRRLAEAILCGVSMLFALVMAVVPRYGVVWRVPTLLWLSVSAAMTAANFVWYFKGKGGLKHGKRS